MMSVGFIELGQALNLIDIINAPGRYFEKQHIFLPILNYVWIVK